MNITAVPRRKKRAKNKILRAKLIADISRYKHIEWNGVAYACHEYNHKRLAGSSSSLCLNKSEFISLLLNKYDKLLLKLSSGEQQ